MNENEDTKDEGCKTQGHASFFFYWLSGTRIILSGWVRRFRFKFRLLFYEILNLNRISIENGLMKCPFGEGQKGQN